MTRIERLGEAVQIMKGMWGEGAFSFEGQHFRVAEVDAVPKPYSPIPLMIGGGGPKILALAAQQADIVGINPKIIGRKINPESMATTAADAMDEKLDAVRAAAGDKFDELELQVQIFKTVVTDNPQEAAEQLGPAFGLPADVVLNAPFFQIGSVEQITENLQAMRDRWGISYILFQADGIGPMGPVVDTPRRYLTARCGRRSAWRRRRAEPGVRLRTTRPPPGSGLGAGADSQPSAAANSARWAANHARRRSNLAMPPVDSTISRNA